MLKIWGRDTSSNVQKPLWAAEELNLKYERIDVGGPFGGLDKPDFLAMNPNARIPVIQDDGFVLWESNAIVRYLAAKDPTGKLLPASLQERAICDQWMDWQQWALWTPFTTLIVGLVRTPAEKRDVQAIENARKAAETAWALLDKHLATRSYVAGTRFTCADIPAGIFAWRRYNLDIERTPLPHLDAWYERLKQRKPYQDVVMHPLA